MINNNETNIKKHTLLEEIFETILFNCRFIAFLAVFGSMVASFVMFIKGSLEVIQGVNHFLKIMLQYNLSAADDKVLILAFIPAIDNYLFATILLVFSMGIYELFISEIDPSLRGAFTRPNWLSFHNIDDLKTPIGKVIVMILIVNLFQQTFSMNFDRPIDILFLSISIILVAASLLITQTFIRKKTTHIKTDIIKGNIMEKD